MSASNTKGRLYGVGLGPGDPELVTLKSMKAVQSAPVVAWFAKRGKKGHARTIAEGLISEGVIELPLVYPVTTEIHHTDPDYNRQLSAFYDEASALLADHMEAGRDVALLCEGDPLFYGSFMHPYIRLKERFDVVICPGVTGMSGCWTAIGAPVTWGDDVLCVIPGTLPREELEKRLTMADAVVVMKLGKNFQKVREIIENKGLLDRSFYVERGTMAGEIVMPLADKIDGVAPYFSMIIVPGEGRRPR
jgi:precorrin-2/cobalt-factor-2 C20-methyltransferase